MKFYRRFKAYLALREAIRKADNAYLDGGGRFYVLPSGDGKLVVTDKKNFRMLKSKGYINRRATTQDALDECFYFTPFKDGHGCITPEIMAIKRRQYISWVDAQHQLKKASKKAQKRNRSH